MALDTKSKLRFVDGSINASMAITPLEKQAWSKCKISSWILNSVSPHITASVIYKDTTFEVWNAFKNWFSQANGPRISQSQKQIFTFLNGLNDSYSQVRTQILMIEPIPLIDKTFTLVIQEERQRFLEFNNYKGNTGKGRPVCSHYGKLGYIMEKCYKLVGYSSSYKQKGKPAMANQLILPSIPMLSQLISSPPIPATKLIPSPSILTANPILPPDPIPPTS
ncbi:uncharacterized protein LOC115964757 [Quercus lobata]|uniref:uncharacterized protein LOC115964757 n=1 Tax=Quercus lobata TaxID=97700 RepID=UPI001245BC47|nr:uncharacterized protein LOC115964757 [Quercus lobata]